MRAVTFTEFGGPEVLVVRELPQREPGPGEIRIRVAAATVNPTDTGFRSGRQAAQISGAEPPYIPGMELGGVIDAVGPGSSWTVGERVMAIILPRTPGGGAMAETVIVPAESAARVPEGTSLIEAATIPMNGLTVRLALDLLALKPGETLAVTGAAGAVGGYAVEMGTAAGLRVVAISSPSDEAVVRTLGAEFFVPRGDDAAERVRALFPSGVDGLVDAAVIGEPILPAIRDGGGYAGVRGFSGETQRGITIHAVSVREYFKNQAALEELGQLVVQGKLTPRVSETFPPERAGEAHAKMEAGGIRGRLVVVF